MLNPLIRYTRLTMCMILKNMPSTDHLCFIFVFVYALTDLMDGNASYLFWELLKSAYAITIFLSTGDWFGMTSIYANANVLGMGYILLSVAMTIYLGMGSKKQEALLQQ